MTDPVLAEFAARLKERSEPVPVAPVRPVPRRLSPEATAGMTKSRPATIVIAGHEVPYSSFVACDFDAAAPPLVEQLGLGV